MTQTNDTTVLQITCVNFVKFQVSFHYFEYHLNVILLLRFHSSGRTYRNRLLNGWAEKSKYDDTNPKVDLITVYFVNALVHIIVCF